MAAIPKSDLPGHRQLHERAVAALERCQEVQGVDFKESAPWDDLKWHVVHTVLGMGNLRDGGVIIIGAAERDGRWDLAGVTPAHLPTIDVDVMIDQVNKYVSPAVGLDIVQVKHAGKQFLVIGVAEFRDTPLVCKKKGQDSVKAAEMLKEGAVFVRPPGMARTTRVTAAEQMTDLLQLAAEKRARRILEASHRIGMVARDTDAELFRREVQSVIEEGEALPVPVRDRPHWVVHLRPEKYEKESIPSLAACYHLIEQTRVSFRGWDFPHTTPWAERQGQGNHWVTSWIGHAGRCEYWRLYQSGQFVQLHAVEETLDPTWREHPPAQAQRYLVDGDNRVTVPGYVSCLNLVGRVVEIFEFVSRLCSRGTYSGVVQVGIELVDVLGFILLVDLGLFWNRVGAVGERRIGKTWTLDSAELVAASTERSIDASLWFLERFGRSAVGRRDVEYIRQTMLAHQ